MTAICLPFWLHGLERFGVALVIIRQFPDAGRTNHKNVIHVIPTFDHSTGNASRIPGTRVLSKLGQIHGRRAAQRFWRYDFCLDDPSFLSISYLYLFFFSNCTLFALGLIVAYASSFIFPPTNTGRTTKFIF